MISSLCFFTGFTTAGLLLLLGCYLCGVNFKLGNKTEYEMLELLPKVALLMGALLTAVGLAGLASYGAVIAARYWH